MPTLKFTGNEVYGCAGFTVQHGETVEVDEAKAKQLLADFPKDWEVVKPKKGDKNDK